MDTFWKSLQLSVSIGGCLFAPLMALSVVFAHLSFSSAFAKSVSLYALVLALPVLVVSIFGIVSSLRSRPFFGVLPGAKTNPLAIASVLLSISGLCTLGVGSVAGIVTGIFALRAICLKREQHGQKLAVVVISLSLAVICFLCAILLLGP